MKPPINPYYQELLDRLSRLGQAPSTGPNPDFLAQRAAQHMEHQQRVNDLRAQWGIPGSPVIPGRPDLFNPNAFTPPPVTNAPVQPQPIPQMPLTTNTPPPPTYNNPVPVPQITTPKQTVPKVPVIGGTSPQTGSTPK